jgi:hypothetical protein
MTNVVRQRPVLLCQLLLCIPNGGSSHHRIIDSNWNKDKDPDFV